MTARSGRCAPVWTPGAGSAMSSAACRTGLRSSAYPVRRARLARDLLHDRDGALDHERDRVGVGSNAVARDAAGGVGGTAKRERGWLDNRSEERPQTDPRAAKGLDAMRMWAF